ncbi:MAG TPA: hypothetical protein VEK80_10560 [Kribbellaceae bacterium]|nr:hypothetical protein [Kribbellaceae bacterium]
METLVTIARERAVMTAVADLIVAAAANRNLRVAVGCADPDGSAGTPHLGPLDLGLPDAAPVGGRFADHLTQALHARGRPCRCLPAKPSPTGSWAVTVIISEVATPEDADLCRIDIQLDLPAPAVAGSSRGFPGDRTPDIVIDYEDPRGPTIRYVVPALDRSVPRGVPAPRSGG